MNSQFGLANVWAQGDIVTKSVAVLLLLMSLASWMVIIIKTLDLIKYKKIARAAEAFWHSEDFDTGLARHTNGKQCVVDAPNRAEQTDKWRRGAH